MKYLLSMPLLLSIITVLAQNKPTITVLLYPMATQSGTFIMADSVQFFRLPEDQAFLTPDLKHWHGQPMPLNIYPGGYRIAYRNMFGQTVNKNCRLYQDSMRIDLCPDSLTSYPDNTLARLQDKDSLVIDVQIIGCFGGGMHRLVIRCKGRQLEATYFKGRLITKTLTPDNVAQFIRFENELQHVQDLDCTTTCYYNIKSKYLTLDKKVGDCSWGGLFTLTTAWFGK